MPFATADDILERWAGENPPTQQLAGRYATDAEVLIRSEFTDIDERIDADPADGGVSSERVKLVVFDMVKRALWNPDRKTSEGITDYSVGYEAGPSQRRLELTADERAVLAGSRSGSPRAFSVVMGPTEPPSDWIGGTCDDAWT